MRRFLLVFVMLSVCFALVPASAQDGPSGELVVALANDPVSLFMPRTADITATNTARQLYDSLVFVDDNNDLQPALAERWEIAESGTEYTFYLRQGVTFHNGEPFNAESVVVTWQYSSDPSNDYAELYQEVIDIEVVDDFTVILRTAEPNPVFMTQLAGNWGFVPPQYMAEVGIEGFERNPVGTGPFKFVERVIGERVVYEANTDYWVEGQPQLARVTFRVIPDSSTRLAAIQTGEIDIANRLSIDEVRTIEGAPGVDILSYPNDRVYYVAFKNIGNGVGTPLEDARVRLAMNYAVNREAIINAIFGGEANLISGFILPSNLGFDESIQPYPYDVERARELLAEAGYADGFSISLGCPADAYLNINDVCLSLQRELGRVGIDVSVEFKTTNAYWSEPQYGAVGPMYVDSWSTDLGEAINRLQGALIPGAYYAGWEDETITSLINSIASTVDRDARAALYAEIQQVMYDNPPFIYLYQPNIFEAVRSRVEGYLPRSNEGYFLSTVRVND